MRLPFVRACSIFIAAAAGIALLVGAPEPAFAEPTQHDISHEEVQLRSEPDGCPGHVITGSTSNPDHKILVESGEHDITINNVYIELDEYNSLMNGDSPFAIGGNATVHLTIEGTNSFASHVNYGDLNSTLAAIWVQPGSTLIIDGPGRLVAKADDPGTTGQTGAAGIGGGYNQDFGDIIINGGRIEAYGSAGGAGIGGGYSAASGSHSGNITINGGYVQAFGGSRGYSSGAGIGAGENSNYTGTITINGGVVRAVGGDADQTSIGGGGHATGGLNNGTFTTGENGNAVIFAPWGIGDMSGVADWDCILLESTRDEGTEDQLVNYSQDPNGRVNVTFKGGTPQVYGDVKADYDIQVNAPASLRIETDIDLDGDPDTPNNEPSTLTMLSGTRLINNNEASDPGIAGIALMPGSTLVLQDGVSQCWGDGTMIATSAQGTDHARGRVQLPLSDDMVTVSPTTYVYDGDEKKPQVTVEFNEWNFTQRFTQDTEYTVSYANNVEKGTATATATSAGGNLLNTVEGNPSTGSATFEITEGDFTVSTVSRRYVQVGETHLLSKLPSAPTFGTGNPAGVEGGTFEWFANEECTQPLTNEHVKDAQEGDQITIWWKYTQTGNSSVVASKTGSTTLIMTDEEPPLVQVDGSADDVVKQVTYGNAPYTPRIQISLDNGGAWIDPKSDISYAVQNQTPADRGDVVTVDQQTGVISFVGAGTATVTAEIEAYTDPAATDDNKGDTYGPAFVTIEVVVSPAQVTVNEATVQATDRPYDGTRSVDVFAELDGTGIVGDDAANGNIDLSATGTAAQPEVGEDIPVTVSYELTGDKADDYVLTNSPATTVTISKAQAGENTLQGKTGELTISNCVAATYAFDLQNLVPDSKPVNDDDALYPGWIMFENPRIAISDNRYFDEGDIRIDNTTQTLYLTVSDVEVHDTGELGTITLDMVSPHFEGMTGTIRIMREDMQVHTITARAGEGGSISPEGAIEVVDAHDQAFTVIVDEGYELDRLLVDGQPVALADDGTYTFENVTADHTIEAVFKNLNGSTGNDSQGTGDSGQNGEQGNGGTPGGDNASGSNNGSDHGTQAGLLGTGDSLPIVIALVAAAGVAIVVIGARLRSKR